MTRQPWLLRLYNRRWNRDTDPLGALVLVSWPVWAPILIVVCLVYERWKR